jgi:hypothetical protein
MTERDGQYILDIADGKLQVTFLAENHISIQNVWDDPLIINRVPLRVSVEYVLMSDGTWKTGTVDERTGETRATWSLRLTRADWTSRPGMDDRASHSAFDKVRALVEQAVATLLVEHPDAPKLGQLATLRDACDRKNRDIKETQKKLDEMIREHAELIEAVYELGEELEDAKR